MTSDENRYQHTVVEEKWRKAWKESALDTPDILRATKPYYNLMMFPYPSAEGLHVGNMYAFTGSDIYGRFKRMAGYDVFEPIGLDGFGIHSENYAFKIGKHPMDQAAISQERFYNQLHTIGAMYDWSRTVETYDPSYYKWTQWLFVAMFKHGLAYRGKAEVNWCPSCKTVLADEQVTKKRVDSSVIPAFTLSPSEGQAGIQPKERLDPRSLSPTRSGIKPEDDNSVEVCERCGNTVEKRQLEQWFFKITAYAEKLLQNSYTLDWSEKVKLAQQQWIGKKEGVNIQYQIANSKYQIECFTTRPDTIFGATFVVLSPAHPLAGKVKEVVNPATKKTIPVFVDEYVLGEVGTGAIMGVPAYDERDMAFAKRMGLPIVRAKLTDKTFGEKMVTYHLRDWLISRQRYWGPPIPMVYCAACAKTGKSWFTSEEAKELSSQRTLGSREKNWIPDQSLPPRKRGVRDDSKTMAGWYPVPEKDLPVVLPRIDDYKPGDDGVAPLAKHKEFYETTCPKCGGKAVRETDVSDTFLDSSWYFLRYPSVDQLSVLGSQFSDPGQPVFSQSETEKQETDKPNSENRQLKTDNRNYLPWDREITRRWLPVPMYTGGAEHSVLHLMYSRFVTMALHDMGYIDFDEPFATFYAHGLVIKDGAKMSKSKGNVVNPDEYIERYGADALRLYLMFTGPYDQGGDFRDSAMEGMSRWVQRVWRLAMRSIEVSPHPRGGGIAAAGGKGHLGGESQHEKALHRAIKKVGEDIQRRRYNTAIAAMMELVNVVTDEGGILAIDDLQKFLLILAPFAPYMTEELWQRIHNSPQPPSYSKRGQGELPESTAGGSKGHLGGVSYTLSIHLQPWPAYDEKLLEEDTVQIVVQVNGKLRDTIVVSRQSSVVSQDVETAARSSQKVARHLEGKTVKNVKNVIFVPGRLINFVSNT